MLSVHGIEGIGPVRRATAVAETTDGARLPEASLRGLCGGAVHLPGDPGYDMARSPWNLQIQHHPAAVAYPANPAEVADVLAGAQQAGLRVVPQGTGHGRLRAADREGSGSLTDRIRRKRAPADGSGPASPRTRHRTRTTPATDRRYATLEPTRSARHRWGTNDEMTSDNTDLATYYQRRAPHYDEVYAKTERQADLRHLEAVLLALFTGRDVLEVAAGTGYWTSIIATTATTVTATDYNSGPLAIARSRSYPRRNVRLQQADAFALDQLRNTFTASFVGFWWSHIPHLDTDRFLRGLCTRLRPHSPVAIVDNRYVEGSSHPITHTDAGGNTYQDRTLADGSRHRVRKNFPTAAQLRTAVAPYAAQIEVLELSYYWLMTFTTKDGVARST